MKIDKLSTIGILCLIGLFALVSCSKTEYEPTKLPYNEITRFAVSGFVEGDSLTGVISQDEILVYWDQAVALPEAIRPTISVSEGATVSPASGQSVALNENTSFTVTAQDGTAKDYTIRFILQQPEPIVLAAPNAPHLNWAGTTTLLITGQYFLAGGDTSAIRVFARRLKDGVEFDMDVDHEFTNSVSLRAKLPAFTAEADTGRHDIFLTIGQKTVEVAQGRIAPPPLLSDYYSFVVEVPKTLTAGDEIAVTIDDKKQGEILKFYKGRFAEVWINAEKTEEQSYKQIKINNLTEEGNTIKFKIPADIADTANHDVTAIWFRITDPSHWEGFQTYSWNVKDKGILIK